MYTGQQVQKDLLKGIQDLKLGEKISRETANSGNGDTASEMTEKNIEFDNGHFDLLPVIPNSFIYFIKSHAFSQCCLL